MVILIFLKINKSNNHKSNNKIPVKCCNYDVIDIILYCGLTTTITINYRFTTLPVCQT